jgi:hypothetical protein
MSIFLYTVRFPLRTSSKSTYVILGLNLLLRIIYAEFVESIGKPMCSSAAVSTMFDYSLQSMKPQDIKDMGLPLTVIPCSWQRN